MAFVLDRLSEHYMNTGAGTSPSGLRKLMSTAISNGNNEQDRRRVSRRVQARE